MPPLASWGGAWPLGPPLKSATGEGNGGKGKSEGKRKEEVKGVKGKMRVGEEKGTNGRDGGERKRERKEKKEGGGKWRNFAQL